jgi:hypothetical protein
MTKLIKILESVLVEDLTDNELASEGNDQKLDKYLRLIFKQMKKVSGLDELMAHLQTQSEHFYRYNDTQQQELKGKVELISKIPKFLGAKDGADRYIASALVYTFLNNGGYDRDFSKDELDLTPLVTYDLDGKTTRETTTFETGWGEVFANSEEEAIEKFQMNPENWVSDSEHDDTDYGDYLDVNNVTVTNTNERSLTLLNLGFA